MPLNPERLLAALYEASPDAIVVADASERIVSCNAALEAAFGYQREELVGEPVGMLLAGPAGGDGGALCLCKTPGVKPCVVDVRRKDGSAAGMRLYSRNVRDAETGRVTGCVAVMQDLTEETARTNALAREREAFRRLYEHTPAILHSIDTSGAIVHVSDLWLEKLGYAREEVIGRKSTDFLDAESRALAVERVLPAFWRDKFCDRVPYRFVKKNGEILEAELSAIIDESNPRLQTLAVIEDVTVRNEANRSYEASNRALRDFASGVAHDLRAPLRHIALFSEILQQDAGDGRLSESAAKIQRCAEKMTARIKKLLDYSKASYQELAIETLSLSEFIEDIRDEYGLDLAAKGARLTLERDARLQGDRELLSRLFGNLVENALKFAADAPLEIRIDARREDRFWRIDVADNGVGVAPGEAETIFEPFRRFQPERDGVGLGLSLCRMIAESHGGKIWLSEGAPGRGAVFSLLLPAAMVREAADAGSSV